MQTPSAMDTLGRALRYGEWYKDGYYMLREISLICCPNQRGCDLLYASANWAHYLKRSLKKEKEKQKQKRVWWRVLMKELLIKRREWQIIEDTFTDRVQVREFLKQFHTYIASCTTQINILSNES